MSRQPDRDWRGPLARLQTRAGVEARNDNRELFWLVLRAVTVPLWLPLYIFDRFKQRRLMIALANDIARNRIVSERLIEEAATAWVELQPHKYPLGKYDPKFASVIKQFRKILNRRRR